MNMNRSMSRKHSLSLAWLFGLTVAVAGVTILIVRTVRP